MHKPSVIAFSGHMIDQPDRATPRFPAFLEVPVQRLTYEIMARMAPAAAVASAACGGDLLFAEAALLHGVSLTVVLPFEDREDFLRRSVSYAGSHWVERFERVCSQATRVLSVSRGGYRSDQDFEVCQHALLTTGHEIATTHTLSLMGLVLCDVAQLGHLVGGTHSFIQNCRDQDVPYGAIDLARLRQIAYPERYSGLPLQCPERTRIATGNAGQFSNVFLTR